jgi:hypothetical protein
MSRESNRSRRGVYAAVLERLTAERCDLSVGKGVEMDLSYSRQSGKERVGGLNRAL